MKILNFIKYFFIYFIFSQILLSQTERIKTHFSQKDFEKNKILDTTFHFYKNQIERFSFNDTLLTTLFVDDRNYKGLINYGVQFRSKNYLNFSYIENRYIHFLKVVFNKSTFFPKDSTITIEGYILGGWNDLIKNDLIKKDSRSMIEVFLGEKIDTIFNYKIGNVVNQESIEVKLNGIEVTENTILDTFPAFYFKKYSHFIINNTKGKRFFKINGKVTDKTILAIGCYFCYSEIFDLGAMLYSPTKNKKKKVLNKKNNLNYKILLKNNELLLKDLYKKNEVINYYTYTEQAEDYILKRQFAKAKEQYLVLDKKYPVLFARDLHNAIRCAIFARDYQNAFYWAEKMAKKGISFKYFDSKIFKSLKKQIEWNKLKVKYDSIYNDFQIKKSNVLKEELEKLLQEDQSDYGLQNRKQPKVLYETTEKVTNKLIDLLMEYGFPSEEKIGVFTKNDTIILPNPDYHVLIRHAIQQKPNKIDILNNLLENSIKNYEYDSKRSSNNIFLSNSCFHIYKGNLFKSKSCGSNDLMVRKMKFIFNNPYGFFIHTENYVEMEFDTGNPEENDKFYKENFDFIMKISSKNNIDLY